MVAAAPDLLGRDVTERPQDEARSGEAGFGAGNSGDSEVHNLDVPILGDQDVGRLNVAVDNTVVMRVLQGVGHLGHERHLVCEAGGAAPGDDLPQIPSL